MSGVEPADLADILLRVLHRIDLLSLVGERMAVQGASGGNGLAQLATDMREDLLVLRDGIEAIEVGA